MNRVLKIFFIAVCLPVLCVMAQDEESPSKRINSIKRNGSYIYAEATAATEAEALDICGELIRIEVSKYVALRDNLSNAEQVIIKDAKYGCQSISMPRGEMTRVFIYVRKSDLEPADAVFTLSKEEIGTLKNRTEEEVIARTQEPEPMKAAPAEAVPPAAESSPFHAGNQNLSSWQVSLLRTVAECAGMRDAKIALNRFKAQNKVNRLGDDSSVSARPGSTYYAIYGPDDVISALLAPGEGPEHYDFISGRTVDIRQYSGFRHLWFTISK